MEFLKIQTATLPSGNFSGLTFYIDKVTLHVA